MNKVSIVTVVCNDVIQVEATIKSVIEQDYPNFEYIIIDAESTDGTLEVISRYMHKINKLISEKDTGIYNAMNKSLSYVTGSYIIFMNSGDQFYDNHVISRVFKNSKLRKYDVIYGSTVTVNGDFRTLVKPKSLKEITRGRMIFVHQSAFVKTDVFKKFQFNESYKINSDYDFFLRLFSNGYSFIRLNIVISLYKVGGISSKAGFRNEYEKIKILKANDVATVFNIAWVSLVGVKRLLKKMLNPICAIESEKKCQKINKNE